MRSGGSWCLRAEKQKRCHRQSEPLKAIQLSLTPLSLRETAALPVSVNDIAVDVVRQQGMQAMCQVLLTCFGAVSGQRQAA
jgi:hypothetical protein